MAGELTLTNANGMGKRVYDKELKDVRPKCAILQRRYPFVKKAQIGESYQVGIQLRPPNGFTYSGSSGTNQTLKQPRPQHVKQATLTGYELNLVERPTLKALSQAVEQGDAAFGNFFTEIGLGMMLAHGNRIEATMLHGQRGYGTVESINDLGGGVGEIFITAATFAPGMFWAIGEQSTWDSFTGTTKNNATAALVLTKIDAPNRKLTVTYGGTFSSEVAAGDILFPEGAWDGTTHADAPGLLKQASTTSGTTPIGLDADTYNNAKGNTYTVSGEFGYATIEDAMSYLRDRGAEGKLAVYLSNRAFSRVAIEVFPLLKLDEKSAKRQIGSGAFEYMSADVGAMEIVNHPFMKWGEFLVLPIDEDEVHRTGSSDISMGVPGSDGKELFTLVSGTNTVELQTFSDQAPICKKPNWSMLGTGITY